VGAVRFSENCHACEAGSPASSDYTAPDNETNGEYSIVLDGPASVLRETGATVSIWQGFARPSVVPAIGG